MNKTYLFLLLFLFAGSASAQTAAAPSVGDGTSGNPYQISTLQNLYWITQNPSSWGACFVQTADIDASPTSGWASGAGFSPIGGSDTPFSGSYDGQGHSITGLYINSDSTFVGFIGLAGGGSVSNLALINVNVTAGTATNDAGALVGLNYVSISNCYSSGSVNGPNVTGGLVGQNSGSITYSGSAASVSGAGMGGGLAGSNNPGATISHCYSTGSVSVGASGDWAGGLTSYGGGNGISDCYSTATVTGSGEIGGLVGEDYKDPISNCYSAGSVTGSGDVGGLLGLLDSGSGGGVTNSFWDTETSGQTSSAGGTGETSTEMKTEATFTGASWDFTAGTGVWSISSSVNNGYPTLQGVTDYSLPVQATDFVAEAAVNSVTLMWKTQSEVDNAGFNILRQDPGTSSYRLIAGYASDGSLRGLGTSSTGRSYSFTDDQVVSGSTYNYEIQSVSTSGASIVLSTLSVVADVPKDYALYQNYPNPFNPTTAISYQLPAVSHVTLKLYDVLGREVTTLVNEVKQAGSYTVRWDASRFASGVYFYRIVAKRTAGRRFTATKKLMLLK